MTRFDDLLMARARAKYPNSTIVSTEPYVIHITHPEGGAETISIAAIAWEMTNATDAEIIDRIDRQLGNIDQTQIYETPPWQRLMPLLRASSFAFASQLRGRCVVERVDDYLCVMLGIDHDDGIQIVNPEDVARWGVDASRLFAAAYANLRQQASVSSFQFTDPETGQGVVLLRGLEPYGYQTSLAFLPDLVAHVTGVAGRQGVHPVLFFPSRNDFFMVPSDRPDLIASAFDEALEIYRNHPRPLTPSPYTYDAHGQLTFWWPPADLLPCSQIASAYLISNEYAHQRAYFEVEPDGIAERDRQRFAILPAAAKTTGQKWAILPKALVDLGNTCLLPMGVDHVGFQTSPDAEPLFVRMPDFLDVCGIGELYPMMQPPLRVIDWPNPDQWTALQRCRVSAP